MKYDRPFRPSWHILPLSRNSQNEEEKRWKSQIDPSIWMDKYSQTNKTINSMEPHTAHDINNTSPFILAKNHL
jgi:hypothetical protein